MKQEKVIELLKQSGIHDYIVQNPNKDEWGYGSDCIMCDGIERFASLVEQATLERAASALDEEFNKTLYGAYASGAEMVRNLAKEPQ